MDLLYHLTSSTEQWWSCSIFSILVLHSEGPVVTAVEATTERRFVLVAHVVAIWYCALHLWILLMRMETSLHTCIQYAYIQLHSALLSIILNVALVWNLMSDLFGRNMWLNEEKKNNYSYPGNVFFGWLSFLFHFPKSSSAGHSQNKAFESSHLFNLNNHTNLPFHDVQ